MNVWHRGLVVGALTEIRRRSLRIPQDLSFVSSDDIAVTDLHSPPISTVRSPSRRLPGWCAAKR